MQGMSRNLAQTGGKKTEFHIVVLISEEKGNQGLHNVVRVFSIGECMHDFCMQPTVPKQKGKEHS
jgi:hypothetical protein